MHRIVWITGRAAAGKSTVIAACVTRLRAYGHEPAVLSDEELLFRLKEADVEHCHHYHPHGDHRFLFRDGYLFDEGLRRINARLLEVSATGSRDIVLVELARGATTAVADVSYRRALELIAPLVWAQSLVFYLDVADSVQVQRNRARSITSRATPEPVMRDLYAHDDPESLAAAGIIVHAITADCPVTQAAEFVLSQLGRQDHRNGIPSA